MKAAASTKPNAAASADAGAFFSKTAKGHARVTPWIELLRGLLLRTYSGQYLCQLGVFGRPFFDRYEPFFRVLEPVS